MYPNTYLEVASIPQATTFFHGHTRLPIRHVAIVTLTSFKTLLGALGWSGQAGTGEITVLGTQLIVAVGWTGEG